MGTCCSRRDDRGRVHMAPGPGRGTAGLQVEGWSAVGPGSGDITSPPHVDGWSSLGPGKGDRNPNDGGSPALGPGKGAGFSGAPVRLSDTGTRPSGSGKGAWPSGPGKGA